MKPYSPSKEDWDKEGLKKLLDQYPGAKSVTDVFKRIKENKNKPTKTAAQFSIEYQVMRAAINWLKAESEDFDYSTLDDDLRRDLAMMPIRSEKEITLWRDAWLKVFKGLK